MRDFPRWALEMGQRLDPARPGLAAAVCLLALMVIGSSVLDSAGGSGLVMAQARASRWALWRCGRSRGCRSRASAWTPMIYALSMLPLLAVFVLGTGKYGRQWLNLGLFYLQPAELLKVSLPMMVA